MEGLDFESILGEDEVENLFVDAEDYENGSDGNHESNDEPENPIESNETDKTTEVVDPEDLFSEEEEKQPESVGSGEKVKEKGDATTDEDSGTSPENFYSSIASALAVDGIFPNLEEEKVKQVSTAEGLSDLIEAEVDARLDEKQRRVSKALDNGVEPDEIRKYEGTISYINSITDAALSEESEKGEQLRYQLITQDFLNKGYTNERADKMARRAIEAGTDIDDAKEALQSNKEFFQTAYNKLLQEAQAEADKEKAEMEKQSAKLKDSILKDKTLLGDMEISNDVRKKAFETISKPVYKDPETGQYLTALQRYQLENKSDFLKYVGLFYTVTNGFKDFESFAKGKVKKEVRKGLRELEQTLNNTRRASDGSLNMVTGVREDPESFIGKGFKLDI